MPSCPQHWCISETLLWCCCPDWQHGSHQPDPYMVQPRTCWLISPILWSTAGSKRGSWPNTTGLLHQNILEVTKTVTLITANYYGKLSWILTVITLQTQPGNAQNAIPCTKHPNPNSPDHIASLQINANFITSHIATAVREASFCTELIQHITNKSAWQSTTIFDTIDCEACSWVSLSLLQGKHLMMFKLEFDPFATMSQHHKMEKHFDHWCPRCSKPHENLNDVLQCPQAESTHKSAWV